MYTFRCGDVVYVRRVYITRIVYWSYTLRLNEFFCVFRLFFYIYFYFRYHPSSWLTTELYRFNTIGHIWLYKYDWAWIVGITNDIVYFITLKTNDCKQKWMVTIRCQIIIDLISFYSFRSNSTKINYDNKGSSPIYSN